MSSHTNNCCAPPSSMEVLAAVMEASKKQEEIAAKHQRDLDVCHTELENTVAAYTAQIKKLHELHYQEIQDVRAARTESEAHVSRLMNDASNQAETVNNLQQALRDSTLEHERFVVELTRQNTLDLEQERHISSRLGHYCQSYEREVLAGEEQQLRARLMHRETSFRGHFALLATGDRARFTLDRTRGVVLDRETALKNAHVQLAELRAHAEEQEQRHRESIDNFEAANHALRAELKSEKDARIQFEAESQMLSNIANNAKQSVDQLTEHLDQKTRLLDDKAEQLEQLTRTCGAQKMEEESLRQQLDAKNAALSRSETNAKTMSDDLKAAMASTSAKEAKVAELETNLAKLKEELARLSKTEEELASAKKKAAEASSASERLSSVLQELRKDFEASTNECNEVKKRLATTEDEMKALTAKSDEYVERIKSDALMYRENLLNRAADEDQKKATSEAAIAKLEKALQDAQGQLQHAIATNKEQAAQLEEERNNNNTARQRDAVIEARSTQGTATRQSVVNTTGEEIAELKRQLSEKAAKIDELQAFVDQVQTAAAVAVVKQREQSTSPSRTQPAEVATTLVAKTTAAAGDLGGSTNRISTDFQTPKTLEIVASKTVFSSDEGAVPSQRHEPGISGEDDDEEPSAVTAKPQGGDDEEEVETSCFMTQVLPSPEKKRAADPGAEVSTDSISAPLSNDVDKLHSQLRRCRQTLSERTLKLEEVEEQLEIMRERQIILDARCLATETRLQHSVEEGAATSILLDRGLRRLGASAVMNSEIAETREAVLHAALTLRRALEEQGYDVATLPLAPTSTLELPYLQQVLADHTRLAAQHFKKISHGGGTVVPSAARQPLVYQSQLH